MNNVTWEQLTEDEQAIIKAFMEARGGLFYSGDFIRMCEFGLLTGDRQGITLDGIRVYAQRNAAPASSIADKHADEYCEIYAGGFDDGSANNPLSAVWRSTAALYERFGLKPTVQNTANVYLEEVVELLKAGLWESPANTALEAADVIVTALGVCMARSVALEEVAAAIQATVAKNDAKTHAVNAAGKIARR